MRFKKILIISLLIFPFICAEQKKIKRGDIPGECFYFKSWAIEDSFYIDEYLNKKKLEKCLPYDFFLLNIKKDDEFKPETLGINSKWEAVFVKKIKYILINI